MKSILLTIAYQGTNYAGWQVQENALAIQECMMKAGACFLSESFTITTASRTDSGVHAMGQRALLKAETEIPAERICEAFNHYLPADIKVWKSELVDDDFHPRYHAKKKLYVYKVWNSRIEIPEFKDNYASIHKTCDFQKMQYIAKKFEGEHDFNAFSSSKKTVTNTIRQIYRCQVVEAPTYIDQEVGKAYEIYVEGNGFLYNMVRMIAGCIVYWSNSKISLEEIDQHLEYAYKTGQRDFGAKTMPAKGLSLLRIDY